MTQQQTGLTTSTKFRSASAWEWAHEVEDDSAAAMIPPEKVVAVMVTHNAEEWLPKQLEALSALDPRPGRILVVDNGSSDATPDLLEAAAERGEIDEVIPGDEAFGFGEAVNLAMVQAGVPEWLWLLHDDSAPKPSAFGELLKLAHAKSADVIYPKLLMLRRRNYPDQLQEAGRSMASSGRLIVHVEPGDIDQRHLDSEKTLGGSTAGMLVTGAAWEAVGGFAPEIKLFRDGLEFGWRANQRGFKVVTCPQAALYHRQAGRLGWRESQIAPDAIEADRIAALRLLIATRTRTSALSVGWLQVTRTVGFFLGKAPASATSEWRAWRAVVATPDQATALAEREPKKPKPVARLRPRRFSGVKHAFDVLGSGIVERYREMTSDDHGTSLDELTGGDYAGGRIIRRIRVSPFWVATVLLTLLTLVAARGLLAAGSLAGGSLLPSPTSLTEAWHAFWVPTAGVPGTSPVWLGLMALTSTVTLGNPALAIKLLVLGAPVLAFWAANVALRPISESATRRVLLASVWAIGVLVFGFVGAGSLTGIVASIVLPMLVAAVARWAQTEPVGAERWRAPAATAGWLVVLAAFFPLAWPLAAVGLGVWLIYDRSRLIEVAVALGGSLVFFLGWLPVLAHYPGRLLTGVDPLAAADFVPGWNAIFGVVNQGAPPIWVGAVFLVGLLGAGGYAAFRLEGSRTWILGGLVVVGYVAAVGFTRFIVPINGGFARPDAGPWLLVALGGLIALIALGIDSDGGTRVAWGEAIAPALTAGVALVAVSVVGISGPLHGDAEMLPSHVIAAQDSVRATRTLMIELQSGDAEWALVSNSQPSWGSAERDPASANAVQASEYEVLASAIAQGLVPEDLAQRLTNLGVGHIWVRGASASQIATINNTAGLTGSPADDETQLWTVANEPARARIEASGTQVPVTDVNLSSNSSGGTLVLAEAPDSRWRASLGGKSLAAVEGQTPEFVLPAGGGTLSWRMAPATTYLWAQILVALALAVLSAPVIGGAPKARRGVES